jgi:hypothetical protein
MVTGAGTVLPYSGFGVTGSPHLNICLGDPSAVTNQVKRVLPGSVECDVREWDRQAVDHGRILTQVDPSSGAASGLFGAFMEVCQLDLKLVLAAAVCE